MRGFRLLRASGTFELPDQRDVNHQQENSLDVEFAPPTQGGGSSWVSIVIGRNGVGKSRLLAGVANIFDQISRGRSISARNVITASHIEYLLNDNLCVIDLSSERGFQTSCNGVKCLPEELPLPEKIIALTTTPFDKFKLSRSVGRMPDGEDYDRDRYAYLGLRDRTGRASPTATVFRALEGLFDASKGSDEHRARIADVFEFLGYEPRIDVRYRVRIGAFKQLEGLNLGEPLEDLVNSRLAIGTRPLERLFKYPKELAVVREIAGEILSRINNGEIKLRASFPSSSDDDNFFRRIQYLRRLGLMHMSSVEIQRRADKTVLDLRLASSGELGIVTSFLGLASVISENSLIFIDEPEISLHPEWQARYVDLLTQTFAHYPGCHLILATHSPLILSDIDPRASNVVSLEPNRRHAEDAHNYAGKSYDFLLATIFDEPGNNNLYLKEEIIKALRLAADGKTRSQVFIETLALLGDSLHRLEPHSPVAQLIVELQHAADAGVA